MLGDLAVYLAAQGHEVTVITSRQLYEDSDARLAPRERVHGVEVVRVPTTRFGRGSILGRALDYATFYLSASVALWRACRPGVTVVAKTDPPLISVPAAMVCGLRGARLVNWLQDLFPEVAQADGARFALGWPGSLLVRLRDYSLRRAALNVALGERMAERLRARAVPAERVVVIGNWADGANVRPVASAANPLRGAWGLGDDFVVAYSGNMGRVHEFATILEAMRLLRQSAGVRFLFIGGGRWRGWLEEAVRREALQLAMFKPYQPQETLPLSLGVADVHLVSLQPAMEGLVVPSKFYGIAAAGRPTIFIGDADGEIARLLTRHEIGMTVAPGDAAGLVRALRALRDDPAARASMGLRARALFEQNFDRPHAMRRWEAALAPTL